MAEVIHEIDAEGTHQYCYARNAAGGWEAWVAVETDGAGNPLYLRINESGASVQEILPDGCTMDTACHLAKVRAEECARFNREHPGVRDDD